MNVVPFPQKTWSDMLASSATYAPFVVRLVGFFMLHDHANEPDHDPGGALAVASVPGLADLSKVEQEFVWAGAMALYYPGDITSEVRDAYQDWIDEGAPE